MLLRDPISGDKARMKLVEDASLPPGVLARYSGVVSQADTENKNGRIYERALWEKVMGEKRFQEGVKGKTFLGEPDHPEKRTESVIEEASHTLVEAHLESNGDVRGTVDIFDLPLGRIPHKMLQAGVRLGFSTRGDGDLQEDEETGKTKVDPESYIFQGVDFVLNPSFVGAGPDPISEGARKEIRTALMEAVEGGKVRKSVVKQVEKLIGGEEPKAEPPKEEPVEAPKEEPKEEIKVQPKEASRSVVVTYSTPEELQRLESALGSSREVIGFSTGPKGGVVVNIEASTQEEAEAKVRQILGVQGGEAKPGVGVEYSVKVETTRKIDTAALERVLVELRDAHFKIGDLEEQLESLKKKEKELGETLKASGTKATSQLKGMMKEMQEKHLEFVERHKRALKEKEELQKKVKIEKGVIEELKKKLTEATTALKKAEKEHPQAVKSAKLSAYKQVKTEGVEVPDRFKKLLGRAGTEQEVDTIVESLHQSLTLQYPDLPVALDSRAAREEVMRGIDEQLSEEKEPEEDPEAEEQERITEAQLRGR